MNARRLFIASCIALITSAFSFMIRQNIADPLGIDFQLTKQEVGSVMGAAFLGMAVSMLLISPLCDWLGMGRVVGLAWLCHLVGIVGTIMAPRPPAVSISTGYTLLYIATFLVGCGNGLLEVAINPLAATLFPKEKTHYLNILHAWWPGGLIMSGLLAIYVIDPNLGAITERIHQSIPNLDVGAGGWKLKMALLLVPLAIYGLMCVGQRFPVSERVEANVSTGRMLIEALRPMFLIWGFCMLLTASTELGPNQWQESVLIRTAKVSGTLVFVYTSGLMFIMRFFAGPLAHALSPVGMLTGSAALSAIGLYSLSMANNTFTAFAAATVFGVGIAYFWPTMLGVTAERFPKGGAFLLGLMGSLGNLAIFFVLPQMGAIYDSYTVANLPSDVRSIKVAIEGKETPLVSPPRAEPFLPEVLPKDLAERIGGFRMDKVLPPEVADRLYPAGFDKINPPVLSAIRADKEKYAKPIEAIDAAEAQGAAWAFRWVAVLPCALVVIFGLIAFIDFLRGGYKSEVLLSRREENELFSGGAQGPVE